MLGVDWFHSPRLRRGKSAMQMPRTRRAGALRDSAATFAPVLLCAAAKRNEPFLAGLPAHGHGFAATKMTTMQTIQCPQCRHTFLSYSVICPECGLKRPKTGRSKWGLLVALVTSGLLLAATGMMVRSVLRTDKEPVRKMQTSSQVPPRIAHSARDATVPAIAQSAMRGR